MVCLTKVRARRPDSHAGGVRSPIRLRSSGSKLPPAGSSRPASRCFGPKSCRPRARTRRQHGDGSVGSRQAAQGITAPGVDCADMSAPGCRETCLPAGKRRRVAALQIKTPGGVAGPASHGCSPTIPVGRVPSRGGGGVLPQSKSDPGGFRKTWRRASVP
jgi:hypothetical protein